MHIKGHWPAIITPFNEDGVIDYQALSALVRWYVDSGVDGLVVNGTTAESATLTELEQDKIVEAVLLETDNAIPVMCGTGCHDTNKTVKRSIQAARQGIDACLVVTPYYNKPSQQGLIAHYLRVLDACDKPIMLYNVPFRTGVDLGNDAVERLFEHPNCLGIKAADGDAKRLNDYMAMSPDKALFTGDDANVIEWLAAGGCGVISVAGNLVPRYWSRMVKAVSDGDVFDPSDSVDLISCLNWSTNPVPIKYSLYAIGKISTPLVRLPLLMEAPEQSWQIDKLINTYRRLEQC